VKAVALHAGVANRFRQRHELGDRRLAAMEAGVEAGHLRHGGEQLVHHVDRGEVVGLMERCQRDERPQVVQHLRCDDAGTGVLRPAVHDAVADAEHARSAVAGAEPSGEHVERGATVGDRRGELLVGDPGAGLVLGAQMGRGSDPVDLTARREVPHVPRGAGVHAELQAR
jgi:hypothetical protein